MLQAKKIARREMKLQLKEEKKLEKVSVPPERKNVSGDGSPIFKQEAKGENGEIKNDSGNESEESHRTVQGEVEQELDELEVMNIILNL